MGWRGPGQPRNPSSSDGGHPDRPADDHHTASARIGPQDTVNAAVTVGRSRGARVAVAVYDRQLGTVYAGGEANASYPSTSLVKDGFHRNQAAGGRAGEGDPGPPRI